MFAQGILTLILEQCSAICLDNSLLGVTWQGPHVTTPFQTYRYRSCHYRYRYLVGTSKDLYHLSHDAVHKAHSTGEKEANQVRRVLLTSLPLLSIYHILVLPPHSSASMSSLPVSTQVTMKILVIIDECGHSDGMLLPAHCAGRRERRQPRTG